MPRRSRPGTAHSKAIPRTPTTSRAGAWVTCAPAVPPTHVSLTFLDIPQPQKGRPVPSLAVSPDGRTIVYTARGPEGNQLWIRSLDDYSATPIPGTPNARAAVYSPDGSYDLHEVPHLVPQRDIVNPGQVETVQVP